MPATLETKVQVAPWEAVQPHEQLFVLITGANSGIGLATGQRLIDEFLATRSLTSHLILLPTTRSASKCRETIHALRSHADQTARSSTALRSRYGSGYRWEDASRRIHVVSLTLDLCDLRGLAALAAKLRAGEPVGNPTGVADPDGQLAAVRVPRFDSVIFNAAYGGWVGCDYPLATWKILTEGLIHSVTWPTFKIPLPTNLLNNKPELKYPAKPPLSEVFCACLLGHYILAHHLSPLLSRPRTSALAPGRIIWSSSIEAIREVFTPDDIQGLRVPHAYESVKRLTDILSLTCTLPSVRPITSSYLVSESDNTNEKQQQQEEEAAAVERPRMYLTHPGVVASTLFPVPWFFFWAYELALAISRWLGSPWHTKDSYTGSKSAAWVALQDQQALDALDAERVKWGSSSNRKLEVMVKRTEVEGWGWQGRVEDATKDEDGAEGVLRKVVGRRRGIIDATEDDIAEFEQLGRDCWEQMEELREEWEEILGIQYP